VSDWGDKARVLDLDSSVRVKCCGNDRSGIISHNTDHYHFYCFRCGKNEAIQKERKTITDLVNKLDRIGQEVCNNLTLPPDSTKALTKEAHVWLWKRGIGTALAMKYNLQWSESVGRLIIPCMKKGVLVGIIARDVSGKAKLKALNTEGRTDTWYYSKKAELAQTKNKIVLVEDCFSCMKVGEVIECVSLNGTSLDRAGIKKLIGYKEVIVLLDPDRPGRVASIKIKKKLKDLVNVRILCPDRDPKYLTEMEIRELIGGSTDDNFA